MLEVLAQTGPVSPAANHERLRILFGDIVLEIPVGTAPEYVGRVMAAVRATC